VYDGVDLMSNIMLSMLSICSEMERDLISKRVKAGMNSEKVKAKLKAKKNKCKDLNQDELLNDYKNMTQYALSKKYNIANCQIKKYCERILKEKEEAEKK
jgi:DNA invertase Pin-like site-specific DNA recombinase